MKEKIRIEENDKLIPRRRKNHQQNFNMPRSIPQKTDAKVVMTIVNTNAALKRALLKKSSFGNFPENFRQKIESKCMTITAVIIAKS